MSARLGQEPALGQSTLAAAVAALLLAGFDILNGLGRSAQPLPAGRLAVIALAHVTTLLAFTMLCLGLRAIAVSLAKQPPWLALVGSLDGALVAYLVIVRQHYATFHPSLAKRSLVLLGCMLITAGLSVGGRRWPRAALATALAGVLATACLMNSIGFREHPYLRMALTLTLVTCLSRGVAAGLPPVRGALRFTVLAVVLALLAPLPILRASESARSFIFQFSSNAGAVLRLPVLARRVSNSQRRTAHRSAPCTAKPHARPEAVKTALSGSLKGADVLILSLDALRWDHGFALKELLSALGPHVRFARAVSPAPNTKHALPAVMRGVPAREIPFSADVPEQGVGPGAPSTLAKMLRAEGYRAVQIPTQRFFDPRVGLTTDFEIVRVGETAIFTGDEAEPPGQLRAAPVLGKALSIAKTTTQPLLLWTHLLETHSPYRHGKTSGPQSSEGQVKAIRSLSHALAKFIPRYRAARGSRPLIALVFGDHGEEFGEHGGREHGATAYAEVARVAFAIHAPGLPATRVDAPVSTAAGVATVLDLLGVPIPRSVSLPSLLPCILDPRACPVVADTQQMKNDGWVSYTGARYRLVFGPRIQVEMAFDSVTDPYDRHDLRLSGGALPPELTALHKVAEAYDRAHCAAAPLPNE